MSNVLARGRAEERMKNRPRVLKSGPPIEFLFDEKKAVAAAGVLLNDVGGNMPYLRLIKLLYLAERESIARRGRPIVGGHYVSMNYGPVLSEVLDLVRCGGTVWSEAIESRRLEVYLKASLNVGPLSGEEIALLLETSEEHKKYDRWTICRLMHKLPEWKNPQGGSIRITAEDILEALNCDSAEIEAIRQQSIERAGFDKLFGF